METTLTIWLLGIIGVLVMIIIYFITTRMNGEREGYELAITTLFVYSECMGFGTYWNKMSTATHVAKLFIEKYPIGTDWEDHVSNWETELHAFYTIYTEEHE